MGFILRQTYRQIDRYKSIQIDRQIDRRTDLLIDMLKTDRQIIKIEI